jgi:hypothetical protein
MSETCDQPSRPPHASVRKAALRSQGTCALAGLGLLLVAGLSPLRIAAMGIQHIGNRFVCSGTNSVISLNDTNGSIVSVTSPGQASNIAGGGEYGLWSATFKEGGGVNAALFSSSSPSHTFNWTLTSSGNPLLLVYSNADVAVTVTVSNRDDGVDFAAQVQPRQKTVLEFDLPRRLRFAPANLQRLICPLNSSDGVGAAFKAGFFQSQPEADPAGWTTTQVGEAGYISLFGSGLVFRPDNDPAVPVNFTGIGSTWLGTNVVAAWSCTNAIVNRPPAAGQADVVLLDSTNGPYFSGSHLGGAGCLFRLGGLVDSVRAPLAQDVVIAAIEHLAQAPPGGRTKVALLDLEHGPANGGWAAVAVSDWLNRLQASTVLASARVQVVALPAAQAMLDALASTNYLAILNPYGEWTPALESTGITGSVAAIGRYVRAGGNWFETGGYSFYYALLPAHYYSNNVAYPPAFADFFQLESVAGNASLFGVQPVPVAPWLGSNNPAAIFVPGRLAWGGDALGGYCERAFGAYVSPGQSWASPVVRLAVGHTAPDALQAYCQANGFNRGLADKMAPAVLDPFKRSVLVYYNGNCADKTAHAAQLPSPALVHFADYLMGGFDKEYPDHLPPNAAFGTPAAFTNFLAACRQLGVLVMPYTNPTWWCDHPRGPTFLAAGTAPLLLQLDGTLSYENYSGNDGYTVCHWHPAVQAANRLTVGQFTTNYPVDMLFEDQCGARTWQYDLNPASPTPYAYAAGIVSRVAEDSQTLPLSTEDGWDRLVNHESQFCGMTWGLVPTANPPSWRSFLRDRFSPETWDLFPLAEYIAHDKVSMVNHDLGQFVTDDEVLAWTLGLGYGLSYRVNATDLDQPRIRQWLLWLDRLQKSVCALYVGEPVTAFSHAWGTNAANPDNGILQATYGQVNIVANLGPQPLGTSNLTLAPFGFCATAPGMVAANVLPAGQSPVAYVAVTNGNNAEFWIYTSGEQSAAIGLPAGLSGAASVQLDGHTPVQVQVQNAAFAVALGLKPGQDRIQPPAALASKAPRDWPGNKPAIGILNLPGMPASWTSITPANWLQAFKQSALAIQFGVPIKQITSLTALTAALQAGPAAWLAIINPCGEVFPESGSGQWTNTLGLIHDYVNNGGSWWETAGYSFYTASWLQSTTWQTETVGPGGLGSLGLPVGGGENAQPAEPLIVTAAGQTMFGEALSMQLQGLTSSVNRGLLRTSDDPGHLALLAGAQQDFMGGYRLDGWGYLWRIGGFWPNPDVVLPAVPAVMTFLYTNPPLPAVVSPVKYLWHGSVTFASRPVLKAVLVANGGVSVQVGNCPTDATNYLERSPVLDNPSAWQTVFTFNSPPIQTNWTDPTAPSSPRAFYRVRSALGP